MGEVMKRVVSATILAAFYIFALSYTGLHKVIFFLLIAFLAVQALAEFFQLATRSEERRPHRKTGIFIGLLILSLVYLDQLHRQALAQPENFTAPLAQFVSFFQLNLPVFGAIFFFALMALFFNQLLFRPVSGSIYSVGTTFLGIMYIVLPFSHLLLLSDLPHGVFYTLLVTWSTSMTDTMGYFVGRFFGRHKAGIAASPNKTYEGYAGGIVGQLLLTFGIYYLARAFFSVPDLHPLLLLAFSLLISAASILGDLSESLLKRDVALKDSGNLIPGHGGLLDRVDSLIFTVPAFYYAYIFTEYLQGYF